MQQLVCYQDDTVPKLEDKAWVGLALVILTLGYTWKVHNQRKEMDSTRYSLN